MQRRMLKGKIHRATVTEADLHYEGSITIDRNLMEAADLAEYEAVDIYNVTNGQRFSTYVIEGERGRGDICLNGAAARCVAPGDLVIIAGFGIYEEAEIESHEPKCVFVDETNRICEKRSFEVVGCSN